METKYKKFVLKLTTLAPVHIGSGKKYSSKEYIYENGKYYFPDMGILYDKLSKLGLASEFEGFLLDSRNRNKRLIGFLKKYNVKEREFAGYHIQEFEFVTDKKMTRNSRTTLSGEINDTAQFIRDAEGNPYIPGSSLKGALRTILMNTYWRHEYFVEKNKENKMVIPWGAKKSKKFDDIFHEIRVSDSTCLSHEQLMLVQKFDFSKKATSPHSLPIFRESLKPLTKIEFEIITSTQRAADLVLQLERYAHDFYNGFLEKKEGKQRRYPGYKDFFLKDFPESYLQNNLQAPIYLGGGSGVWTKTIFEQAEKYVPKRYKHKTKMKGRGVLKLTKSPEKFYKVPNGRTSVIKNSENLYEMGKACFVVIKEVNG